MLQGSFSSPVLFILLTNYLLSSASSSIHSFADETYQSVYFSSDSQHLACTGTALKRNMSVSLFAKNSHVSLFNTYPSQRKVQANKFFCPNSMFCRPFSVDHAWLFKKSLLHLMLTNVDAIIFALCHTLPTICIHPIY